MLNDSFGESFGCGSYESVYEFSSFFEVNLGLFKINVKRVILDSFIVGFYVYIFVSFFGFKLIMKRE